MNRVKDVLRLALFTNIDYEKNNLVEVFTARFAVVGVFTFAILTPGLVYLGVSALL